MEFAHNKDGTWTSRATNDNHYRVITPLGNCVKLPDLVRTFRDCTNSIDDEKAVATMFANVKFYRGLVPYVPLPDRMSIEACNIWTGEWEMIAKKDEDLQLHPIFRLVQLGVPRKEFEAMQQTVEEMGKQMQRLEAMWDRIRSSGATIDEFIKAVD